MSHSSLTKIDEASRILGGKQLVRENFRNSDLTGLDLSKLSSNQLEQLALADNVVLEIASSRFDRVKFARGGSIFYYKIVIKTSGGHVEESCFVSVGSTGTVVASIS